MTTIRSMLLLLLVSLLPVACSGDGGLAAGDGRPTPGIDGGPDGSLVAADLSIDRDGPVVADAAAPATPRLAFRNEQGDAVTSLRYGDAFVVRATGLPSGAEVTLRAQLWGYRSAADFVVDPAGTVDLARDAPVRGSYTGVDPDGLIWSMVRETNDTDTIYDVEFVVERVGGERLAAATLQRPALDADLQVTPLAEQGLVGTLFAPKGGGPHAAVLVLGGSEGGVPEYGAAYIASLGYPALALAYFGAPGLPQTLTSIPLEYFKKGAAWLAARPEVDPARLGVAGGSRGGELALLLGARLPELRGVFADVPSGVLWGSAGLAGQPAWTVAGAPLPFVTASVTAEPIVETLPSGKPGYRYAPTFTAVLDAADPAILAAATIPVEQATGRVVLIAGKDDGLWPSCALAQIAMDRLMVSGHQAQHGDELHCFVEAGHYIGAPGWSTTETYAIYNKGVNMIMGGTPAGVAHAQRQRDARLRAWLATL